MIGSEFYLCALPNSVWNFGSGSGVLNGLINDVSSIERRLPKKVNLESERARYILSMNQIQSEVLNASQRVGDEKEFANTLLSGKFPLMVIGNSYLEMVMQSVTSFTQNQAIGATNLLSTIVPPEHIREYLDLFSRNVRELGKENSDDVRIKTKFFQNALENNAGVIEIQNALKIVDSLNGEVPSYESKEVIVSQPVNSSLVVDEIVTGSKREIMVNNLRSQIFRGLKSGTPVNFSNQPHDISTEVLNEVAYKNESQAAGMIRIIYADGSEGEAFPLFALAKQPDEVVMKIVSHAPLRIALVSMRHLELDGAIDMSWYRNREASQSRTLSEADRFCYQYSLIELDEVFSLSRKRGGLNIHIYHTGFEPAVIAFYRGLANKFLSETGKDHRVVVTPFYYRGPNPYQMGTRWV